MKFLAIFAALAAVAIADVSFTKDEVNPIKGRSKFTNRF
jgi:hypothetical protein